jgi:hypothetical protein
VWGEQLIDDNDNNNNNKKLCPSVEKQCVQWISEQTLELDYPG